MSRETRHKRQLRTDHATENDDDRKQAHDMDPCANATSDRPTARAKLTDETDDSVPIALVARTIHDVIDAGEDREMAALEDELAAGPRPRRQITIESDDEEDDAADANVKRTTTDSAGGASQQRASAISTSHHDQPAPTSNVSADPPTPSGATTTPAPKTRPQPTPPLPADHETTIFACSTAGPPDRSGKGDRTWSLLSISTGTYLVGTKISPAPLKNTHVAIVRVDDALRRKLAELDRCNTPPSLGCKVIFTGLQPMDLAKSQMARLLGKLKLSAYEPRPGANVTSVTAQEDLPFMTLDPVAVKPVVIDGNNRIVAQVQTYAANVAATYLAVPMRVVNVTNVHKVKAVVLAIKHAAQPPTPANTTWVELDMVLSTVTSKIGFNDTLAGALGTAAAHRELVMFTGKHPAPNKNDAYCGQVYLDGAHLARVHPSFPRHHEFQEAGRQSANAIDDPPTFVNMDAHKPTPASFPTSAAAAAKTWDEAHGGRSNANTAIAAGTYEDASFIFLAPREQRVDNKQVVALCLCVNDALASAFIDNDEVLRCITPLYDAGVEMGTFNATIALYCVETWPQPFKATVTVERVGDLLRIADINLDDVAEA